MAFSKVSLNMKLVHNMHKLMFMLNRGADTALQEHLSISYMQMLILLFAHTCPGITQREITMKLQVTPGAISRQVDALHKKGCLIRETNKSNRREHNLTLTKQGKSVYEKSIRMLENMLEPVFSSIEDTDKKHIITNLETVIGKLQTAKDTQCEDTHSI